jgi:hypothetical protein
MPTFRLSYGTSLEFDGQTAGEVVPILHASHVLGSGECEDVFLRRLASELCEWSGDHYCFSDRDSLARSMMKNGLLEIID